MTKKHYEAIAAVMKSYRDYGDEGDRTLRTVSIDLADYFQTDNKNFDRARFLQACGIESPCPNGRAPLA